jgi:hypothetical protein
MAVSSNNVAMPFLLSLGFGLMQSADIVSSLLCGFKKDGKGARNYPGVTILKNCSMLPNSVKPLL